MLDDDPVLKERVMVCGAFGGIALFALSAVNLMVSGGFDFGVERADYNRHQPSAYVRAADAAPYVGDRFQPFIESAEAAPSETLVGANDGSTPLAETVSSDVLHQQIASLYEADAAQADEPIYEDVIDAEPAYDEEQAYIDQSDAEADKLASVYGSESLW